MTIRFRAGAALLAGLAFAACGDADRDRLAGAPAPITLPAPTGDAAGEPNAANATPDAAASSAASSTVAARAGDGAYDRVIQVYKTPTCGCCGAWVEHAEAAGFEVEVLDLPDLSAVKAEHGITRDLASCHTSLVGGYFVEGHVPADLIERLLREKPAIRGIAVPGMPMGSPGMEGPFRERYNVIAVGHDGARTVYDTRQ
jgi:hypothetical protein